MKYMVCSETCHLFYKAIHFMLYSSSEFLPKKTLSVLFSYPYPVFWLSVVVTMYRLDI